MIPIQWDKIEAFTAPKGMVGIRYAISDRDGVCFEYSMHDATIRTLVPAELWIPVHATPVVNAKIERLEDRLVVLCGHGNPNDPMGNLILWRVASAENYSMSRVLMLTNMLTVTLLAFGVQLDKQMIDTLRRN